jgi:phage shock protein PspC (stress-responsive transcriptional regulator)
VIMVVTILYVIGGVGVIAYMLAALLRPEKF